MSTSTAAAAAPEARTLVVTKPGRRKVARRTRWTNLGVNVLITAVVLAALGFLVPALMGFQRYVITSGSMAGTYDIGSVVFAETVPVAELEVGDVITYVPPAESGIDHLVTHRIVDIDGIDFRTQGDASDQVDPWTFQLTALTQPRAVASVPWVGHVFLALADRGTRMVVIGVPAAIIALLALVELVKAVRTRDDEDDADAPLAEVVALPVPAQQSADPQRVPSVRPSRKVVLAGSAAHAAEAALAADAVLATGAARGDETIVARTAASV